MAALKRRRALSNTPNTNNTTTTTTTTINTINEMISETENDRRRSVQRYHNDRDNNNDSGISDNDDDRISELSQDSDDEGQPNQVQIADNGSTSSDDDEEAGNASHSQSQHPSPPPPPPNNPHNYDIITEFIDNNDRYVQDNYGNKTLQIFQQINKYTNNPSEIRTSDPDLYDIVIIYNSIYTNDGESDLNSFDLIPTCKTLAEKIRTYHTSILNTEIDITGRDIAEYVVRDNPSNKVVYKKTVKILASVNEMLYNIIVNQGINLKVIGHITANSRVMLAYINASAKKTSGNSNTRRYTKK